MSLLLVALAMQKVNLHVNGAATEKNFSALNNMNFERWFG